MKAATNTTTSIIQQLPGQFSQVPVVWWLREKTGELGQKRELRMEIFEQHKDCAGWPPVKGVEVASFFSSICVCSSL